MKENIFIFFKESKKNDKTNINNNLTKKIKYRKDNIRSKIINHFCNYLINFLNDYVKKIYNQQKVIFEKINYKKRKYVDISSLREFMNNTIKDFCKIPISSKSFLFNKYYNYDNLLNIQNELGETFINLKLSQLYQNYYLNDSILINEQFGLSEDTKNFNCLLDNYKEKKIYQEQIKECGFKLINDFIKKKPRNRYKEKNLNNYNKSEKSINDEIEQNNLLYQNKNIQNLKLNFEENNDKSNLLTDNLSSNLFETFNFGNIF